MYQRMSMLISWEISPPPLVTGYMKNHGHIHSAVPMFLFIINLSEKCTEFEMRFVVRKPLYFWGI
jgi:hypothetical protein